MAQKYWCTLCRVFVVDSKIERAKHEATWKHKRHVDQNLRNLEQQNRKDKEHAKEVQSILSKIDNEISKDQKFASPDAITDRPPSPPQAPAKPAELPANEPEPLEITITDPTPETYTRRENRKRPANVNWKADHSEPPPAFDDLSVEDFKPVKREVKQEPKKEETSTLDSGAPPPPVTRSPPPVKSETPTPDVPLAKKPSLFKKRKVANSGS